jgi:gluconolactonase
MEQLAEGLAFPEGPVAMSDGTLLVCEIAAGRISRIGQDGSVTTVAEPGGGPNGAAFGPDGKLYICNNGGVFEFAERFGMMVPESPPPAGWSGGSIQRVDIETGAVETLYTESLAAVGDGDGGDDGDRATVPLLAPNDLVFDAHGGMWFTDHGARRTRSSDRTGVHYAAVDGSRCAEVLYPLDAPNGIGLSPDGRSIYVAETHTGRLWRWDVVEPGVASGTNLAGPTGGDLVLGLPGMQLFDSLAVDAGGYVCVGTLVHGGITVVSADGSDVDHIPLPDPLVTNVCFGGDDHRTAFVTLSATGRLVAIDWPRPGLPLANET